MNTYTSEQALLNYVAQFNETDEETIVQAIPNERAAEWMLAHVPRVRLPEPNIERTYYFRWWTYRKHIKRTPDGLVVTEFHPDVPWAGKHNTIVASGCHHVDDGRWLRDTDLLDQYIRFFYRRGGTLRSYSHWMEHAILGLCSVRANPEIGIDLLPEMIANYAGWDESNLHESGLYWSSDDRDASEFSISGNGLRPTLNCYQYANARAIATFARLSGENGTADSFDSRADALKTLINGRLWDERDRFYKVIPLDRRDEKLDGQPADPHRDVREIWGYLPWLYDVAPQCRSDAFKQLLSLHGFAAAHGLTTAERRHPCFGLFYTGTELNDWLVSRGEQPIGPKGHECLWNGPSWPYSTCMALGALSNLLNAQPSQSDISAVDYLQLLTQYARAHVRRIEGGRIIPWIDENLNPDTGDWISRTRLKAWDVDGWSDEKGGYERGKDYNHSAFANLVIGGLFGIAPTLDCLKIQPLFPAQWPYASLEGVQVHGHIVDVFYDRPSLGGEGYRILVDGRTAFRADMPTAWSFEGQLLEK